MRNGDFSGSARTEIPRSSNCWARALHSASRGSLRSSSYSLLRGWNQVRSLLADSSRRKWIASGLKPVNRAVVVVMLTPMLLRLLGWPDRPEAAVDEEVVGDLQD